MAAAISRMRNNAHKSHRETLRWMLFKPCVRPKFCRLLLPVRGYQITAKTVGGGEGTMPSSPGSCVIPSQFFISS